MSTFHLLKTKDGFYPADQDSLDKAKKVELNEVVQAKSIDQRNYSFLKKYWKLARFVADNIPETENKDLLNRHQYRIKDKDDFHFFVKLKKGYIERKFIGKDGNIGWQVKSISFVEMEPDEFDKFYSDALDVAFDLLSAEKDLTDELVNYMG